MESALFSLNENMLFEAKYDRTFCFHLGHFIFIVSLPWLEIPGCLNVSVFIGFDFKTGNLI